MGSHTPGPWVAQGRHGVEIMGPDYKVAELEYDEGDTEGYECARADARLIAAAPDLLSALEAMRDHDTAGSPCDRLGLKCDCVARADAAIAKARGGT